MKDANLSEKLQLDSELTFKKAQDIVRETEAVKKQKTELRSNIDAKNSDIDAIRSGKYTKPRREQNKATGKTRRKELHNKQSCFRCGKTPYQSKEKCPARNTKCKKCSKVVHWVVACRSKMLSEIHDEIVIEDADCVFYGEGVSQDNALWKIELKVDGENVQFKMDTRKTFLS